MSAELSQVLLVSRGKKGKFFTGFSFRPWIFVDVYVLVSLYRLNLDSVVEVSKTHFTSIFKFKGK
jgi:hypothetical protein